MSQPSFQGRTVVAFEGLDPDRVAALIEEHRGIPLRAPAVQSPAPETREAVRAVGAALVDGNLDGLCLSTASGVRMLLDVLRRNYGRERGGAALRGLHLAARAGEPSRALETWSLSVDHSVSGPGEWSAVLDRLRVPAGAPERPRLAMEQNGRATRRLTAVLERDGVDVLCLPTRSPQPPDDLVPLKNGLRARIGGEATAALFTAPVQVKNVCTVAAEQGWEQTLRRALRAGIVGARTPATADALRDRDVEVDVAPETGALAALVGGAAAQTA